MKKTSLFILALVWGSGFASAAEKKSENFCVNKWEYFSKSFELSGVTADIGSWQLSSESTKAGEKGWELVSVMVVNKIQYAIFKRPKNECVNHQALKANPGLKKP